MTVVERIVMSTKLTEVRSVRIICDAILKDDLLCHLKELGAHGWTWWLAHCKCEHSTDVGLFNEEKHMYLEVWCQADVADKIVAYCNSGHFEGVGMTVGVSPLLVSAEHAAALHKP